MAKVQMDIPYVAKLARLRIDGKELVKFEKDMGDIVSMVENLPDFEKMSLDLDAADAMKLREDEICPSMSRKEILANAPQTEAGCFVVPKVVE